MKFIYEIHLSAGRGPAECMWVVQQLCVALSGELEAKNARVTVVQQEVGVYKNTLRSVELRVQTPNSLDLTDWNGAVKYVGNSLFRKGHKRKNWFVALETKPLENEVQLALSHVKFETFRASGPGGQGVNKLETAVRAIDEQTGLSATDSSSRSQWQNKKNALRKLHLLLKEKTGREEAINQHEQWFKTIAIERGNAIREYRGEKFKRIK